MKALDAPLIWLIGFVLLAGAQAALLPLPFPQPLGRDIGAFAVLAGLFFVIVAVRHMRRHKTTVLPHGTAKELVTTGVFGKSRNPIYLGFLLIFAGLSLWVSSVLGLLLVPVLGAALARRFIEPEEARLRSTFGAAFDEYAERTRRWL